MDSFYPSPVLTDVLDSDADGVSDTLEELLQLNPQDNSDASKDEDEDRLNLAEETFLGTSDLAVDTDGDEVTDWDEVFIYKTDPSVFDDYTSLELSGITASAAVTSSSNLLNNGSFSFNFTDAKKTYSAVSATAPTGRRAKRIWNRLSKQNFEGDIIWETGLDTSEGGWQAIGDDIEFWEGQGVEIDEHSGVKQTVELEPGTYLIVWDHRARNDTRAGDSEYSALAKLYEGANLSEKSYAAPSFEEEKANEEETDEQLKKIYDFMRGEVKTAVMTFEVPEITDGDATTQKVELSFQAPKDSGGMGAIINNVQLLSVDIEEVISDQIAGNDCNKLPSDYYIGEPNNPILMATRTGVEARLRIKMNVPAGFASKILVGARKVETGTILGSVASVASPAMTQLTFDSEDGHHIYEIVAGYDENTNDELENDEVAIVFEKTPKTNSTGGTTNYDGVTVSNFSNLDKIIIGTESAFISGKNWLDIWGNLPTTDYAGDCLDAFADDEKSIPTTTLTDPVLISATTEGLSHPVGAQWNVSCQDSSYRFDFIEGSEASNDFEHSSCKALDQIIDEVIKANIDIMLTAGVGHSGWPVTGYLPFTISKDLLDTESAKGEFNELGNTFGKVDVKGELRVSYRNTSATTIEVGNIEISGSFDDIYDFSYWGGSRAQTASLVQAGHASLSTSTASAGKVFFTRLYFNLAFDARAVHQQTYTK